MLLAGEVGPDSGMVDLDMRAIRKTGRLGRIVALHLYFIRRSAKPLIQYSKRLSTS